MAESERRASMAEQIKALLPGETYSKTRRVALDSDEAHKPTAILQKMRNTVGQTVSIARTATGSNFRVETGSYLTDDRTALLLTAAVTRFEDEEDDDTI